MMAVCFVVGIAVGVVAAIGWAVWTEVERLA